MASMDTIKDKANAAAQSAAKAAKYVALASKKRLEIVKEQEKIRRNYAKLGKVYYKDYVTDEEPDEAEYKPLCEAISVSFRRINELREEIAEAKAEYNGDDAVEDVEDEADIFALEEVPVPAEETPTEESAE
ncbi:MAG: hypothetical protein ACI3VQ_01050 [Faecousia sp.]